MLSRQNGTRVEALAPFFMISILLAESKTMSSFQNSVDDITLNANCPVFEEDADAIMSNIEKMTPSDIADVLGISHSLAVKARNLAYDFPHKKTGYKAIFGYTGEAFRGLDATTFLPEDLDRSQICLRFVSSVYGLLKPFDIIKPYRCEFNKPVCPGQISPIGFYRSKNTIEFVKYIKANGINDVIDLLPADADKCLDWKIIRAFAGVHKIRFQQMTAEGKLKTPIASLLKEMRGIMARTVIKGNISSFKDLTAISSDRFVFSPSDSKPGLPVFICD